jgi:hypothetical protein
MLHACLCTICFVFCYTSWHFYAFSRTNLLTRCHSASSLFFLLFCVSKKLHRKYSQNWTKQKPKFLFSPTRDVVQSRDGGEPRGDRTIGWRGLPLARATRWCGHLAHLLTPPFRLYILLDEKILSTQSIFQKTYCKPPPSSTWDRQGPEALPGTMPEREITIGDLLHHHACLRSNVWVVYLGLRVHSSSEMVVFSSMCFMFRSCEVAIMIKIIVM